MHTKSFTSAHITKSFILMILLLGYTLSMAQAPVEENGRLHVKGQYLYNQKGEKVQLSGVSLGWHNWWGYYFNAGATYTLATSLKGDYNRFARAQQEGTSAIDTVYNYSTDNAKVKLPHEFSIGMSIGQRDKWMLGADYVQQNWKSSAYDGVEGMNFTPNTARSFRLGFEFIPNMYDLKYYFNRVTYRFGAYYDQTYMNFGGNRINAAGFTFGMSLPIYRLYNAFNVAVDFGQRGSTKNNLVRERYVQFVINISLHDLWFIKYRYQ